MANNTTNEVRATAKYVRVAPRKARAVVGLIRNLPVAKALEDKGYKFDSAQIEMVPQTYQKLDKQEDRDNMEKMLDLFEEDDDVQNVWHNWDQE